MKLCSTASATSSFHCIGLTAQRAGIQHCPWANRGFEKPGKLLQEEGKSFLELRLRNMKANSRISGRAMKGHLSSLRYIYHGNLKEVEIQEGKIRIPLEICRFHREKNGRIEGMLAVTVTCSVGMSHMPESTAMLYFTL